MKISFDTKTGIVKVGSKTFGVDLTNDKENEVVRHLRDFLNNNSKMTDYEEDAMWMSYRYAIGRHTIASHAHAHDIWVNCRNRMSNDRTLITAYDINRSIQDCLRFINPHFNFPTTTQNRITYTSLDMVLEFIEEYAIKSKEELLEYKTVNIILDDSERGYKFETETWNEYFNRRALNIVRKYDSNMSYDEALKTFEDYKNKKIYYLDIDLTTEFDKLIKEKPNSEYYSLSDIEDLMVWNDLVKSFDFEHHHKSVLTDGSEEVWFWGWRHKTEKKEDGNYYKTFGYEKIRVPLNKWNGVTTTWIPNDVIVNNLY